MKKKTGVIAAFDPRKIYNAICKANIRIADEKLPANQLDALTHEIVATLQTEEPILTVEQIQDAVEEHLIQSGYTKMAKAYILYRANMQKCAKCMQI